MGAGTTDEPIAEGAGRKLHAAAGRQPAPTLPLQELATRLRSLRTEHGLSVEQVAEKLLWPSSRIRQLEAAANLPTSADLRDLRTLFKLDDVTTAQLTELTRKASQEAWWAGYHDLGVPYIGLESRASSITSYTMQYLPALLQSEEYARAIITAIEPQIEAKVLEERVEARLRRQNLLNGRNNLRYSVLLDEAVLLRPVGGRATMYRQLDKVLMMARAHKVDLRIVPFERGAGIAQDSNFVLLQFNEPGPFPVVYVEGLAAYHFLDNKQDVNRYLEEVERLKRSALELDDSVERIQQARDAHRDRAK